MLLRGCVAGFILLNALAAYSDDANPMHLLEEANAAYRELRPADAVRLYREYLKFYPQRVDVRVFLGAALLNLNQLEDALSEAQHAVKLDNRLAKAYILEGRVYAAQQRWDASLGSFEKAMSLQPGDPDAWYFAGRAAYDTDHSENAVAYFQHALQLAAGQWRIYEGLGLAYEAQGHFAEAENAYRRGLELGSASYRPAFALGQFLFKQGRGMESLPCFATALRLAPDSAEVRFEFGRALYQAGQQSEARRVLEQGLPTRDCRIYHLLTNILRQKGEATAADRQLAEWRRCSTTPN